MESKRLDEEGWRIMRTGRGNAWEEWDGSRRMRRREVEE